MAFEARDDRSRAHRAAAPARAATPATITASCRQVIEFLTENWREQPSLEAIAAARRHGADAAAKALHPLGGLSPKAFLQAVTLDHARGAARAIGDRARHDLRGRPLRPGPAARPLRHARGGDARHLPRARRGPRSSATASTPRLSAGRSSWRRNTASPASPSPTKASETAALADMMRRWPRADYVEDAGATAPLAAPHLRSAAMAADTPLRVVLIGSDFEIRVWETLLKVPFGCATTYSDVARRIERPSGGAGRRRGGRQEPDLLRRALPPRARPLRRADRLPLGADAQARHPGLGGRHRRRQGLTRRGAGGPSSVLRTVPNASPAVEARARGVRPCSSRPKRRRIPRR